MTDIDIDKITLIHDFIDDDRLFNVLNINIYNLDEMYDAICEGAPSDKFPMGNVIYYHHFGNIHMAKLTLEKITDDYKGYKQFYQYLITGNDMYINWAILKGNKEIMLYHNALIYLKQNGSKTIEAIDRLGKILTEEILIEYGKNHEIYIKYFKNKKQFRINETDLQVLQEYTFLINRFFEYGYVGDHMSAILPKMTKKHIDYMTPDNCY